MRCSFLTTLLLTLVIGNALQTFPCNRQGIHRAGAVGMIKGTIRSANGDAVGGASVIVEGSNLRRQVESDVNGDYEVELPPGSYRVVVEHAGFRPFRGAELSLRAAATETHDVRLDPLAPTPVPASPSPPEPADFLVIDFGRCQPERKRVDLTYGSVTYEIVGKSGDTCAMRYGKETETPDTEPRFDKTCAVPTSLGKQKFRKGDAEVDFSSLGQYCKQNSEK